MYNLAYWASAHELSFCFPSTEIVVHTCLRRITVPWCFHSVHTTYLATTPGWLPHTCGPTTNTLALHICIQASELTRCSITHGGRSPRHSNLSTRSPASRTIPLAPAGSRRPWYTGDGVLQKGGQCSIRCLPF
ncbi:hypothetical protein CSKR_201350 [Clonorchis sinensis]|uniref:Uncharacterized protein n=1 Tax=Clonorchis sinensis TaxID=79923 RepID=A0A8T1MQ36_CLOSI|nr:hypothetical protein CSKR_201350 [Clonorchis sinensis]